MRTHIVTMRLNEAEMQRIAKLPEHPVDRSDSDTFRRVLLAGVEALERQARAPSAAE